MGAMTTAAESAQQKIDHRARVTCATHNNLITYQQTLSTFGSASLAPAQH